MPDPIRIALAGGVSGLVAAAAIALLGWPWKAPDPRRTAIGWIVGVSSGFAVGAAILGAMPNWPPTEDQDRLLTLVLPAIVIVELIGACGTTRLFLWLFRLGIALLAARVLLHGSVYLDDPASGGDASWSLVERASVFVVLAIYLVGVWATLIRVDRRRPSRAVPLVLGMTCCAAGLTVMLSGYASGGQLGIVLGAALLGAVTASLFLAGEPRAEGAIAFGLVGLFSLLVIGRFFGELSTIHAIVLLGVPLLAALPVARWLPRRLSWATRPLILLLVLIPLAVVVGQAGNRFRENSQPTTAPGKSGARDYLDYGS